MRRFAVMTILLTLATLTGCSNLQSPVTKLTSVRLADQSEQGARLELTVELENPNDEALPLLEVDYHVALAGGASRDFSVLANRTLPAKGRQVLVLPAALPISGGGVQGSAYTIRGSIEYVPPGDIRKLLTESKVPLPSAAFSGSGQVE